MCIEQLNRLITAGEHVEVAHNYTIETRINLGLIKALQRCHMPTTGAIANQLKITATTCRTVGAINK